MDGKQLLSNTLSKVCKPVDAKTYSKCILEDKILNRIT